MLYSVFNCYRGSVFLPFPVLYLTVELCKVVFALIGLIAPNAPANLTLKTLSGKL